MYCLSGSFAVVLHCGTELGIVNGDNPEELAEELVGLGISNVHILKRHQGVRVEPHGHLLAMNGKGNARLFAKIGECVHNNVVKAVVVFTDRHRTKTLALIARKYVLPPKEAQEVMRSHPH